MKTFSKLSRLLLLFISLATAPQATAVNTPLPSVLNGAAKDQFYLVITELGETYKAAFPLTPSRNRSLDLGNGNADYQGNTNYYYWTIGLKEDDIKRFFTEHNITLPTDGFHYYIANAQKLGINPSNTYNTTAIDARPWDNNYELGGSGNTVEHMEGISRYQQYNNTTGKGGTENVFYMKWNQYKSYSFWYNIKDSDNKPLRINVNKSQSFDINTEYYLIGNLKNANAGDAWNPTSSDYRMLMERLIYKGGKQVGADQFSTADSVVYAVTVKRPNAPTGWGELYLGIVDKTTLENTNGWAEAGGYGNWDFILRPQIWSGSDFAWGAKTDLENYNAMAASTNGFLDGQALSGCVYQRFGRKLDNNALSPVVSNNIDSYTFRYNATTSTYNLRFNTKLYIMGPAASKSESAQGSWDPKDAIEMTYSQTDGYWSAKVYLKKGEPFRFAYEKNMTHSFGQNGYEPYFLNKSSRLAGVGNTANSIATIATDDYETPWVDMVEHANEQVILHKDIATSRLEENELAYGDIIATAPSGLYTIRFHANSFNSGSPDAVDPYVTRYDDATRYYYTLNRSFTLVAPGNAKNGTKKAATNLESYTHFRSFSAYHAYVLPTGYKAFAVTAGAKEGKITLVDVTANWSVNGDSIIPANTAVIIAANLGADANTQPTKEFDLYYDDPWLQNTTLSGNKLVALQEGGDITKKTGYDAKSWYIFGYKILSTEPSGPTWGFYAPKTGTSRPDNSCYLDLTDATGNAKAFSFATALVEDDTRSTDAIAAIVSELNDNEPYYNLQGIRIDAPTKPGIYLHGGKKIIIR